LLLTDNPRKNVYESYGKTPFFTHCAPQTKLVISWFIDAFMFYPRWSCIMNQHKRERFDLLYAEHLCKRSSYTLNKAERWMDRTLPSGKSPSSSPGCWRITPGARSKWTSRVRFFICIHLASTSSELKILIRPSPDYLPMILSTWS
jgi:hypothetical protein